MFANMKIGMRLALGFGLVILLLAVIVGVGMRNLEKMDGALTTIVEERYPNTVIVTDVRGNLNVIARSVRNLLLVESKSEQERERARILEARKKIGESLAALEKRVQDEKGKELLKTVAEVRSRYVANQTSSWASSMPASPPRRGPICSAKAASSSPSTSTSWTSSSSTRPSR